MKKIFLVCILTGLAIFSYAYIKSKPTPSVSKSLAFPVSGKRSNIGSFWGDARDGGKRKHEGIDIFAKKRTPVVAVCNGIIISSGNTPRGGKILWLQSFRYPWRAYYAHLDDQKVHAGQVVKKGEVIGTVGNTGNAKYTPSHLHFGIYKLFGGAVNPLSYVKYSPKITVPQASNLKVKSPVAKNAIKKKTNYQKSLTRQS
jgi:murein DD-endopeptidase MepM/ murein hydrolase activator NlpD